MDGYCRGAVVHAWRQTYRLLGCRCVRSTSALHPECLRLRAFLRHQSVSAAPLRVRAIAMGLEGVVLLIRLGCMQVPVPLWYFPTRGTAANTPVPGRPAPEWLA